MAFNNLVTFPVGYRPSSTGTVTSYRYPVDSVWVGGTYGAQQSSVKVDNGNDASTDTNGTGFSVGGNSYANSRGSGLKVDRYGQKDGRVLVRIGHDSISTSAKGMHLYGVVGVAFKYNNVASDSGYKAIMNRIMITYAFRSGNSYGKYVYDATEKLTSSESLGADLGTGDKLYSYQIPSSQRSLVIGNNMTCEGVYLEFKANKSPGCCKNKHIAAQIWNLTPLILPRYQDSLSSSAPSFVHCPVDFDTRLDTATNRSGLLQLATQ